MEILRRGDTRPDTFTTNCTGCGAGFRFTENEAVRGSDRNEDYFKVKCPECGKELYRHTRPDPRTPMMPPSGDD
jgi:endogenous inhibitor of DNA gyrase (YacG/DUF329 family)